MIYLNNYHLPPRVRIFYVNMLPPRRAVDSVKGFHKIFVHSHGPLVPQIENNTDIDYRILKDNVERWEGIRRGSGRGLYLRSR